ncbi:MAG: hypothetical protein ACTSPI_17875 [Candidatus Heimdallarchaeaceae archaeon]
MFGRKKKSVEQVRNEIIRTLWPFGVPEEILKSFEEDETKMIMNIIKVYTKEKVSECEMKGIRVVTDEVDQADSSQQFFHNYRKLNGLS